MTNRRPMESEERAEIIALLKKGNISHREISRRFNRSQSTISGIAKDAAIQPTYRRKRTPAAQEVEGTFSREERIGVADEAIGVISSLLQGGGLSPRDLRETTQSLKAALEARRLEDIEPEPQGSLSGSVSKQELLSDLVAIDSRGVPRFVDMYFATLDYGSALQQGADQETVDEAWSRLVSMARSYGITRLTEEEFAWMQEKLHADSAEEMRRKGKTLPSEVQADGS